MGVKREEFLEYKKKSYTLGGPKDGKGKARLRLNVTTNASFIDGRQIVHVALDNSSITPGGLAINKGYDKGMFQDCVWVRMWIPYAGWEILSDGPANQSQTTSVSSSVSVSKSDSVNIGFFGETPQGGVTHTSGESRGRTISHSYADMTVTNKTTQDRVLHMYKMTASDGGRYSKPEDLVQGKPEVHTAATRLFNPPLLARENMPLISQAVWRGEKDSLTFGLAVKIRITQRLRRVDFDKYYARDSANKPRVFTERLKYHFEKELDLTGVEPNKRHDFEIDADDVTGREL